MGKGWRPFPNCFRATRWCFAVVFSSVFCWIHWLVPYTCGGCCCAHGGRPGDPSIDWRPIGSERPLRPRKRNGADSPDVGSADATGSETSKGPRWISCQVPTPSSPSMPSNGSLQSRPPSALSTMTIRSLCLGASRRATSPRPWWSVCWRPSLWPRVRPSRWPCCDSPILPISGRVAWNSWSGPGQIDCEVFCRRVESARSASPRLTSCPQQRLALRETVFKRPITPTTAHSGRWTGSPTR